MAHDQADSEKFPKDVYASHEEQPADFGGVKRRENIIKREGPMTAEDILFMQYLDMQTKMYNLRYEISDIAQEISALENESGIWTKLGEKGESELREAILKDLEDTMKKTSPEYIPKDGFTLPAVGTHPALDSFKRAETAATTEMARLSLEKKALEAKLSQIKEDLKKFCKKHRTELVSFYEDLEREYALMNEETDSRDRRRVEGFMSMIKQDVLIAYSAEEIAQRIEKVKRELEPWSDRAHELIAEDTEFKSNDHPTQEDLEYNASRLKEIEYVKKISTKLKSLKKLYEDTQKPEGEILHDDPSDPTHKTDFDSRERNTRGEISQLESELEKLKEEERLRKKNK